MVKSQSQFTWTYIIVLYLGVAVLMVHAVRTVFFMESFDRLNQIEICLNNGNIISKFNNSYECQVVTVAKKTNRG